MSEITKNRMGGDWNRRWQSFSTAVVCLSLLSSVTNFIPLSLVYVVLVPALPFLLYRAFRAKKMTKLQWMLLAAYGFFLLSTLRYDARSLFSYEFYRRDGTFFPIYIPLLLFPLLEFRLKPVKIVRAFVVFASALNAMLLLWSVVAPEAYPFGDWDGFFYSLFHSHSAAGGFLLVLCCITLGFYWYTPKGREKWLLGLLLAIDVACLVGTHSRATWLGAAAVVASAIWFFAKERPRLQESKIVKKLDIVGFLVVLIVLFLLVAQVTDILSPMPPYEIFILSNLQDVLPTKLQSAQADNMLWQLYGSGVTRIGTMFDRLFYLWPRAMDLFRKSPLVGMGMGSYDDIQTTGKISESIAVGEYTMAGTEGFWMRVVNENVWHSSAHAHNSYMHAMAENGLMGLILLLLICYRMRKAILSLSEPRLRFGLYCALVGVMSGAFFEYGLFAPAMMLPFVMVLGLAKAEPSL